MSSRCLDIPGNLLLICDQLPPRSLASFARTDSSICCVALDVLWSEQSSLIPLFQTLPRLDYYEASIMGLPARIPPADWANTQAYARRVRSVSFSTARWPSFGSARMGIAPEAIRAYVLRLDDTLIFPNLRALDMGFANMMDCRFLLFFIPPSLRSLTLHYRTGFKETPNLSSILPSLSSLCPELGHLKVYDPDVYHDPDDIIDECTLLLKNAIVGWHALTSVEIVEAHPEVIRHLGTCPNLRDLCIHVLMDLNWLPAESPGFENGLKELTICAFESRYLSAVIKCMSSMPVAEKFEVRCGEDEIPAKQRNLEVIAEALEPTSLEDLLL